MLLENYEKDKKTNKDHVATPRWVVENIYDLIQINTQLYFLHIGLLASIMSSQFLKL